MILWFIKFASWICFKKGQLVAITEIDEINSKHDEQKSQSHIEGSSGRLAQSSINNFICHWFDTSSVCTFSSLVTKLGTGFSSEVIFWWDYAVVSTGFDGVLKWITHILSISTRKCQSLVDPVSVIIVVPLMLCFVFKVKPKSNLIWYLYKIKHGTQVKVAGVFMCLYAFFKVSN